MALPSRCQRRESGLAGQKQPQEPNLSPHCARSSITPASSLQAMTSENGGNLLWWFWPLQQLAKLMRHCLWDPQMPKVELCSRAQQLSALCWARTK